MRGGSKLIGGFFIRFALIDALLLAAWLVIGPMYATAFRAAGNVAFGSFGANAAVDFHAPAIADATGESGRSGGSGGMESEVSLSNTRTHARVHRLISARFLGYVPTVMTASLILATPIPIRRRWRALAWGLALIQLYVALRIWLMLLAGFSGDSAVATFSLGGFAESVLSSLFGLFSVSIIGCYLGPILIWILVTFRRGDADLLTTHTVENNNAATATRNSRPPMRPQ